MNFEQQLAEQKIEEKLRLLLGDTAFRNNMQVPEDISKTARAVRYLVSKIITLKKRCNEEGREHIDEVLEEVYKILT